MVMYHYKERESKHSSAGFSIMETLVAISLLGVTLAAVTRLHIYTLHSNGAVRDYSTLNGDLRGVVDSYRNLAFATLLTKFGAAHINIANGATVTETPTSSNRHVTFSALLTAIKSSSGGAPEAIKLTITATQKKGKLGTKAFNYETIIAQTS